MESTRQKRNSSPSILKAKRKYTKSKTHAKSKLEPKYECDYCHQKICFKGLLKCKFYQIFPILWKNWNISEILLNNIDCMNSVLDTLERHLESHMKKWCHICNKFFQRDVILQVHMAKYHGAPPVEPEHICHVCGKCFTRQGFLATHLKIHSDVRPFVCKYCDKTFINPVSLSRHVTVHTGERPYQCKICGKKFSQAGYMASHRRSHTGEKPHQCTLCEKRFRCLSHLKRHLIIHSGQKPYICDICNKGFAQMENLKGHLKIHFRGWNRIEFWEFIGQQKLRFIGNVAEIWFKKKGESIPIFQLILVFSCW